MRHIVVTLAAAIMAVTLADTLTQLASQHASWAMTAAAKGLAARSVTVALVEYLSSVLDMDKESTDVVLDSIAALRTAA